MSLSKYDTVGGRRYVMCMGACIVTSLLVWYGKIDAKTYGDVIIWITGIYVTGNIAQRAGSGVPDVLNKISSSIGNKTSDKPAKNSAAEDEGG